MIVLASSIERAVHVVGSNGPGGVVMFVVGPNKEQRGSADWAHSELKEPKVMMARSRTMVQENEGEGGEEGRCCKTQTPAAYDVAVF